MEFGDNVPGQEVLALLLCPVNACALCRAPGRIVRLGPFQKMQVPLFAPILSANTRDARTKSDNAVGTGR